MVSEAGPTGSAALRELLKLLTSSRATVLRANPLPDHEEQVDEECGGSDRRASGSLSHIVDNAIDITGQDANGLRLPSLRSILALDQRHES